VNVAGLERIVIQARVVLALGHDQDVVFEILVDNIPGCLVGILQSADAEPLALAQRVVHQAVVPAQNFAGV